MRFSLASIALALCGASLCTADYQLPLPPPPVPACPPGYESVSIDFDNFDKGEYVYNLGNGVKVFALGKPGGKSYTPITCARHQPFFSPIGCPRIFDSAHPTGKDYDLGTPNEDFYGPGWGFGGSKEGDGPNAYSQNKVLIIQEKDKAAPDDSRSGGVILFVFTKRTRILRISLLDMDNLYRLVGVLPGGTFGTSDPILGAGDNAFEYLDIGGFDLKAFGLATRDSGAITGLDVCVETHRRNLRVEDDEDVRSLQEEMDTSLVDDELVDMAMKFVEGEEMDLTGWGELPVSP